MFVLTCTYMYLHVHTCTYMHIHLLTCTFMYLHLHTSEVNRHSSCDLPLFVDIHMCIHTCTHQRSLLAIREQAAVYLHTNAMGVSQLSTRHGLQLTVPKFGTDFSRNHFLVNNCRTISSLATVRESRML